MPPSDSSHKSILLVEDDTFLRDIFSRKVQGHYELLTTTSGEETIQIMKEKKPVAVLLDLNLPDENGFEILKKIRSDQEIANTLVMILTNSVVSEDAIKSNELKADDFLTKANFSTDEILSRIDEHLAEKT